MRYFVGIDIGGTRCKMGIIEKGGTILLHENEATQSDREGLMGQIKAFIDRHQTQYPIDGVGISMPGVVREDGFLLTSGAIKCFLHRNMKEEFEELLQLPVHIENDSKSAAIAEKWLGAAKTLTDFVCITLGTAVGGAIYIDGKLYHGLGGLAGNFGVSLLGRGVGAYSEQSTSLHAGVVAGLCRKYSIRVKERVLDAKEIYDRASKQDEVALACIQEFYHDVAVMLVNIAVSCAPRQLLIGGGISANEQAMKGITQAYENLCQTYHVLSLVEMPEIRRCAFMNEAGMLGAIYPFCVEEQH